MLLSIQGEWDMKKYIFALFFCVIIFCFILYQSLSPLKKIFFNLNTLGHLIENMGPPLTIQQIDEGHTFFYWDEHGIGVFCHPLYYGQCKIKNYKDWIVTSIIIPLKNDIYQSVIKEKNPMTLHFKTLYETNFLFYNPFLYHKTIYSENGENLYIQFNKRDWLFDYD